MAALFTILFLSMHVIQKLTSSPTLSSVMESLSVVPDAIDTAPPNQIKVN